MKRIKLFLLSLMAICHCLLFVYLQSSVLLVSGCDKARLTWCNVDILSPVMSAVPLAVEGADPRESHVDEVAAVSEHGADELKRNRVAPSVVARGNAVASQLHVEISKATQDTTADTDPASSLIWSHSYPSRTFEDQFPSAGRQFKPVIILTYQRCGSSFLGNLFNFDKNAFYVFEPLDSLYSSLYGTAPGWNVPSDIFADNNGQPRLIPYDELIAVAEFLGDLLSCDVDRLPTELLAHGFWYIGEHRFAKSTAVSDSLANCSRSLRSVVRHASARLARVCGRRFSDRGRIMHEFCRDALNGKNVPKRVATERMQRNFIETMYNRLVDYITKIVVSRRYTKNHNYFKSYREIMDITLREKLKTTCIPLYSSNCSVRPLRVAKVVRASMLSMVPLMDWLPDLRVIHLIRDPRPVALSRRDFHESARGVFSESTNSLSERTIREASIYCRQVVADIRWRQRLERRYPGRLYSLTYEQLVDDPVARASDIFRFIEERPSESVLDNFAKLANGDGNKTAKYLSMHWLHDRISRDEFEAINRHCAELFRLHPEYSTLKPKLFRTKIPGVYEKVRLPYSAINRWRSAVPTSSHQLTL